MFRPSALPSHVMSVYVPDDGEGSSPRSASAESSDSILPEYRTNARKLTSKERNAVKRYHEENKHKFSIDVEEKDIEVKLDDDKQA